jgi:archaellin
MAKKIVPIKYTSRDFDSIKADLIEHAKRYYENTYKDFNEASFGSLMLDTVAYVGDIMSFYVDYQANESFLDTASEFNNIIKIGRQVGYKFSNSVSSTGIASFYISIPASSGNPNMDYAPILKKNSIFGTNNGGRFILTEDVRFDNPSNEIRVLETDPATGEPIFFGIKAYGPVISGIVQTETIPIGEFTRFPSFTLGQSDIVEIISVFDLEGNEYYEVDYLSQNVIYKSITNRNATEATLAKEILKPFIVPRRFVVDRNYRTTTLQFGASSNVTIPDNYSMITEPTNAILNLHGKEYISSDSFDPTRLINSDKFGIAPSQTSLIVTYRFNNTSTGVNFGVDTLTNVVDPIFEFSNEQNLFGTLIQTVKSSLELNNETALLGDITVLNSEELKRRISNSFASQNRAVTERDYRSLVYSMPTKFGSVKRINVIKDQNSIRRNLNLYVLCEEGNGYLTSPNQSVKDNVKTWLERHKMINDSIDILDGKVVNYSIRFTAIGDNNRSKYDILTDAISQLKIDLQMVPDFGEPFMITNIYNSLKKVNGLLDVISVKIEEKVGNPYSNASFNFKENTSPDGRYINVPDNVVMELKFPDSDIKGTIL